MVKRVIGCLFLILCFHTAKADFLCGSSWEWGTFYIENNLKDSNWNILLKSKYSDSSWVTYSVFLIEPRHGGAPGFTYVYAVRKSDSLYVGPLNFTISGQDHAIRIDSILVNQDTSIIAYTELNENQVSFLSQIKEKRFEDDMREKLNIGITIGIIVLIFILIVLRSASLAR